MMPLAEVAATAGTRKELFASRVAVAMGRRVRDKLLSREENDRRMDELMDWAFRDGPHPDWLREFRE